MIKETITYTDYNGTERTEDFYFNMTKTELLRMEQDKSGSFSGVLEKFIKAKDNADLFDAIEKFIFKAYGEKSADGRQFKKSEEISESFFQSPAYEVLFDKLNGNSEYSYNFIMGIVPAELSKQVAENPEAAKRLAEVRALAE